MPRRKRKPKKVSREQFDQQDRIVYRISECQTVIDELDGSSLWKVVTKDLEEQRKMLDDNWQDINDPLKLQKARELKFATLHILGLKNKYEEEMRVLKKELGDLRNTDINIPKDYDIETKLEE